MMTGSPDIDTLIEDLFRQEFFAIGFGILLWFAIEWSIARGKGWKFGAWFHDQLDEMLIVSLVGFGLVSFDDVAVRYIENKWGVILEIDRLVYLLSGPITLLLIKLAKFLKGFKFIKHDDTNKPNKPNRNNK